MLAFLTFCVEAGVSKLVLGNIGGGDGVDDSGTEDDEEAEAVPDSDTDLLAKLVINSEIVRV